MQTYSVRQVLYFWPEGKLNVIPVMVTRTLTETNLEGTAYTYWVETPLHKEHKLDELKGRIFLSVEEFRDAALSTAISTIDRLVSIAQGHAERFASNEKEVNEDKESHSEDILVQE